MAKFIDLTGKKFERLKVIDRAPSRKGQTMWNCLCKCGNTTIVSSQNLKTGHTQSCGCYNIQRATEANIKHNGVGTRLYRTWQGMKNRCYNPKCEYYPDYGGRGITVCKEWIDNFESFQEWALTNGYEESLTIDREDNNGIYEPSNCRWVTMKIQSNNRRSNRYITVDNITHTLEEWADISGIPSRTIRNRIDKYKWNEKDAVTKQCGR